jgi:signal transduction histidine kinase
VRSNLVMALRPKVGKPWQFGIHQCSRVRTWTPQDRRIFGEIGRRLEDGLTSLLTLRGLRQRDEELRALNAELERRVAERTAELETTNRELEAFAYTVSHDLRAPARHVGSFLELLSRHAASGLDERGRHYLSSAADGAARMGSLVDSLLTFSRMRRQSLSASRVDLSALAREVVEELEPDLRGRTVRFRIGALPVVVGDPTLLRVVLANLLGNAVKFTAPRAQAEIAVEAVDGPAGEHVIGVRDNGVGFDMAYAQRLFRVFERLHREEEFDGVGIGLATVQRIVSRHGGRVWAEGKPEVGAAFYVALPEAPAQACAGAAGGASRGRRRRRGGRDGGCASPSSARAGWVASWRASWSGAARRSRWWPGGRSWRPSSATGSGWPLRSATSRYVSPARPPTRRRWGPPRRCWWP